MELSNLVQALKKSWSAKTSSYSDWDAKNPAWGQCAVTSCIVQDYFGGEIVWAEVELPTAKISHYFNLIEGKEIDLTRESFPSDTNVPVGIPKTKQFTSTRDYILSFPSTAARYERLKRDVCLHINNP